MIYIEEPPNFDAKFTVTSCFVECNGEILLLHRHDHKPEGNTWGVPAGKVDPGEDILEATMREVHEETGFRIYPSELSHHEKLFVRYPDYDFVYHIFHTELEKKKDVVISHTEHKDSKWTTPKNALSMPLIRDLDACIRLFYKIQK